MGHALDKLLRKTFHRHVDQFGRSKPNGKRRVFKGKRAHDGRPLPFNLQVRPQRATPTFHSDRNSGRDMPWWGEYDYALELLRLGKRVPGLLKATKRNKNNKNIYYTINIEYKNKSKIVYKINKNDSLVAFGILKALCVFKNRTNLGLYPV